MFAPIDNPSVYIKPSDKLSKYIKSLNRENAPYGIKDFTSKRSSDINRKTIDHNLLLNEEDRECIKTLSGGSDEFENLAKNANLANKNLGNKNLANKNLNNENIESENFENKNLDNEGPPKNEKCSKNTENKGSKNSNNKNSEKKNSDKKNSDKGPKNESDEGTKTNESTKLVNLEDLHWVYERLSEENEGASEKVFFHELFKGSEIILPKNIEIDRNPELEKRCQVLKTQQDNLRYKAMTKNVDNVRKRLPEDTIAYQLKQINRHLIAIFQFIMSVVAGFAFGFIGIELLVGNLDFGFRLLLGIICSLVIALAELYFLAKTLNEELVIETKVEEQTKSKIN